MASDLRLSGIIDESIVDGPGIRYVIFTQGCPHHCPGCHNPQTHDFSGGFNADIPGEPFCQAEALIPLVKEVRKMGKTVFVYSGYTLEQLLELGKAKPEVIELLKLCDTLVDGPYVEALRDLDLEFRGSSNQRLIDLHTIFPA